MLDLNMFRASKSEAAADLVVCECGSVWFRPEGITLDAATGRPIDYAHPVTCIECGRSVGTQ